MALEQLTHGMEPETLVLTDDSREFHKTESQITTVQDAAVEELESDDPFDSGLTLQEAAYVYGYSKKTLKTLIEEGRLPAIQVESGRKKKLKWKVFPSGVPLDFFEAIASSKGPKSVTEPFPAPPIELDPAKVESSESEIEVEIMVPASTLNELEVEAPVKEKKRKKKKSKNKHKEEKLIAPETGAIDFSIPATEESQQVEDEWTAEQEALFNALLARLYSDEQEAAESDRHLTRPPATVVGSSGSVISEPGAMESGGATSLEALLAAVGAPDTEANCDNRSVAVVVEDSCTVFDALDENGLLSRLANLEDEVSQLMHRNSNLENKVAELESTLKMLGGTSKTKMSMQTMLFMIPFLLVLCVAATAYLR